MHRLLMKYLVTITQHQQNEVWTSVHHRSQYHSPFFLSIIDIALRVFIHDGQSLPGRGPEFWPFAFLFDKIRLEYGTNFCNLNAFSFVSLLNKLIFMIFEQEQQRLPLKSNSVCKVSKLRSFSQNPVHCTSMNLQSCIHLNNFELCSF